MNSGKERNDANSKGSSEVSTGRGVHPPSPASAQAMEGSRAFQKGNYSCWGCQKFLLNYTVREMAAFGGVFGVVVLAVMLPCLDVALGQSTDSFEVDALGAIKGSLLDPMNNLENWNRGDPCASNWTGFFCHIINDALHVTELQLFKRNLSGTLAPEVSLLSQLKTLDFMWNDLTGSIPKEIGNITALKLILLNGNQLSGFLPDEIGNLQNLNRLQIDQNKILGPIPNSFANLRNVKHL